VRSAARECVRTVADLIEAGLNEGAGRFARTPLWVLYAKALDCGRFDLGSGEARPMVLTGDWKRIGVRLLGKRAVSALDTGRAAIRAQIGSAVSD
jgi:hypothetical protein